MKPSFKGAFYQVLGLEALSKSAAVAEPAAKAWFKAHQQLLWECAKLPPDSALESLRLGRVIPRQFEIETPLAMTNATAGTEIRSFDGKKIGRAHV